MNFLSRRGRTTFTKFTYWTHEYNENNGEFIKCKASLCARGDKQVDGINYKETDLYALTLKTAEG